MSRGSDSWRHQYWRRPCKPTFATVSLGRATLRVDHRIVDAVAALEEVLVQRHGYDVHPAYPEGDTGAYNCRHIGNDSSRPWSSHAWATAIDINWRSNPDGSRLRTNIPPGAIRDIHRIRTGNGAPVWRWGGDWDRDPRTGHSYYDAMHFEIHATPAELATGIVLHDEIDQDPIPHTTVRRGDRGATVAHLQDHLGIDADGIFGEQTEAAVRRFQEWAELRVDGVVGENTWRVLHEAEDRGGDDEMFEATTANDSVKTAVTRPIPDGARKLYAAVDHKPGATIRLAIGTGRSGDWVGLIDELELDPAVRHEFDIPAGAELVNVIHKGGNPVGFGFAR